MLDGGLLEVLAKYANALLNFVKSKRLSFLDEEWGK